MNESIKMSELIIEAYAKCKSQGHRMDWKRYSNKDADAICIDCHDCVGVNHLRKSTMVWGSALERKCND